MPNIVGQFGASGYHRGNQFTSGAFYVVISDWQASNEGVSSAGGRYGFDASKSNAIYGASTTVQPPATVLLPQIKY